MASSSRTSFSLRLATVLPSLLLLTSRRSNRALEVLLRGATGGRLDALERPLQRLVEVLVTGRAFTNSWEGKI